MQLEIVTPDKLLFSSDEIVYLGLRTNDGGIGIEANHIPVIASLDIAPMKYRLADGTEGYVPKNWSIKAGSVHFAPRPGVSFCCRIFTPLMRALGYSIPSMITTLPL